MVQSLIDAVTLLKQKRMDAVGVRPIWQVLEHATNYIENQLAEAIKSELMS